MLFKSHLNLSSLDEMAAASSSEKWWLGLLNLDVIKISEIRAQLMYILYIWKSTLQEKVISYNTKL